MKFRQLVLAAFLAGVFSTTHAMDMLTLQRVVPLPNLMQLSMQQAQTLQLTAPQQATLKQWAMQHLPAQDQLATEIVRLENVLREQILAGASAANVSQTAQALEVSRAALIEIRRQCVAQLRQVLTPAQWQQVLQQVADKVPMPATAPMMKMLPQ